MKKVIFVVEVSMDTMTLNGTIFVDAYGKLIDDTYHVSEHLSKGKMTAYYPVEDRDTVFDTFEKGGQIARFDWTPNFGGSKSLEYEVLRREENGVIVLKSASR